MKSSGSFLTRSSRKRIACSLPSAPAGTRRAAGTVIDDEFDGADERPLPQPTLSSAARQRERETERRRDGGPERRRDGETAGDPQNLSVPPSLRLSVSLSLRLSIVAVSAVPQLRVLSSTPLSRGCCEGAKNGNRLRSGTSFALTLSPSGFWLATKKRIVSIVSSPRRRPFGKPAPVLLPPPGPLLAWFRLRRKKSPRTTATCARMPMLVAFVPSAVNVPMMSLAKRPSASS